MRFWNKVQKLQDKCRPFCTAIIPAAGSSQRLGGENKPFMNLAGVPVLARTLSAIDRTELVDEIIVATQEELLLEVAGLCSRCVVHKPVRVICGGSTRTESVLAAALEADPKAELLAVHDGARPLVRPEDFDEMIRLGCKTYAVAPALPVSDTIKVADMTGLVQSTPERKSLYAVQTPQVFQANLLRAALQSALNSGAELTDDCGAVERLGKEVYLAPGNPENIKITTPLDMTIAEGILKHREAQR